jgi:hypothetical protein
MEWVMPVLILLALPVAVAAWLTAKIFRAAEPIDDITRCQASRLFLRPQDHGPQTQAGRANQPESFLCAQTC